MELADEQKRQRVGVALSNDTGLHGAAEVVGNHPEGASRRCLFRGRVERNDQRGLSGAHVHLHRDRRADHRLQERHYLLRESAKDNRRSGGGVAQDEILESFREAQLPPAHRRGKELLLGREVTEDRSRRDAELSGDVRQGGRRETALGECGLCGVENVFAANTRGTTHAYVNVRSLMEFVNGRLQICARMRSVAVRALVVRRSGPPLRGRPSCDDELSAQKMIFAAS